MLQYLLNILFTGRDHLMMNGEDRHQINNREEKHLLQIHTLVPTAEGEEMNGNPLDNREDQETEG